MLNAKIEEALNKQVNEELFSGYLYLSMASWFDSQNFPGMSSWMRSQAQEELQHAMKIFDFIQERDGRATLGSVGSPKVEWDSPLQAFEDAYEHECKVSRMIDSLMDLAVKEKDHASQVFLQWFVTEQVEEEASVSAIADKLRLSGDHGVALLMVDAELGQRPAPETPA
jgi:ferritin